MDKISFGRFSPLHEGSGVICQDLSIHKSPYFARGDLVEVVKPCRDQDHIPRLEKLKIASLPRYRKAERKGKNPN